jgi:hypothetical protein
MSRTHSKTDCPPAQRVMIALAPVNEDVFSPL